MRFLWTPPALTVTGQEPLGPMATRLHRVLALEAHSQPRSQDSVAVSLVGARPTTSTFRTPTAPHAKIFATKISSANLSVRMAPVEAATVTSIINQLRRSLALPPSDTLSKTAAVLLVPAQSSATYPAMVLTLAASLDTARSLTGLAF